MESMQGSSSPSIPRLARVPWQFFFFELSLWSPSWGDTRLKLATTQASPRSSLPLMGNLEARSLRVEMAVFQPLQRKEPAHG